MESRGCLFSLLPGQGLAVDIFSPEMFNYFLGLYPGRLGNTVSEKGKKEHGKKKQSQK